MNNKENKIKIMAKAMFQIMLLLAMISLIILAITTISAQAPQADYCCEKTTYNAWCQNTKQELCSPEFRKTPTSCDATSFCKPGCCYDSSEGLCMENTPQKVCNDKNGTWADSAECKIPQCNLGCCVLDNQAALVTLTRCKKLSGFYGVETDFRSNIQDELMCIAIAQAQDRGACVYEQEYVRTCKFTTRADCESIKGTGNMSKGEFYKDYLCSAEELGTLCGPTSQTICVPGKDEVYFKDSCGNAANVYDASKVNDKSYWSKVIDKSESCNYGNNNANSKSCGNCDYYLGSLCREASRLGTRAIYGDYICKDLDCHAKDTSDGKEHRHGESWCSYDEPTGEGKDPVGSRHFRHLCVAGEEIVEACEDFRKETCIQQEVNTAQGKFIEAACRGNRWQDCISQKDEEDCLNTDKRDCVWIPGFVFTQQEGETGTRTGQEFSSSTGGEFTGSVVATGQGIFGGNGEEPEEQPSGVQKGKGLCAPDVPPGFKFWEEGDGEAGALCSLGSSKCIVTYEKKILGGKKCIENCECLEEEWVKQMNNICISLGDCGAYVNWLGKATNDGIEWIIDGEKQTLSKSIIEGLTKKTTK